VENAKPLPASGPLIAQTRDPQLAPYTNMNYRGFDLDYPDVEREKVFASDLKQWEAAGKMPALITMRLGNDHTSGVAAGKVAPLSAAADNDLAVGRLVDAVSKSKFWATTAIFILEDDAQNGPDHVDSHRSPLMIISAWNKPGVYHRFANTTDVIATIERVLKLGTLSQFDHFGRPITEVFGSTPDLRPYEFLTPAINLDDKNPAGTRGALESARLDLRIEDAADEGLFNQILWRAIKGDNVPYPGPRRASTLDLTRAR
jgi:hypothetical protein